MNRHADLSDLVQKCREVIRPDDEKSPCDCQYPLSEEERRKASRFSKEMGNTYSSDLFKDAKTDSDGTKFVEFDENGPIG